MLLRLSTSHVHLQPCTVSMSHVTVAAVQDSARIYTAKWGVERQDETVITWQICHRCKGHGGFGFSSGHCV